jgi:hypothetical protein
MTKLARTVLIGVANAHYYCTVNTVKERPYRRNTVVDTDSAESSPIGGGSGGGSGCRREPATASCVAVVGAPKALTLLFRGSSSHYTLRRKARTYDRGCGFPCPDLFFFFLYDIFFLTFFRPLSHNCNR